ncbi:MAG: DUF2624 family protein [Bacilli bacterium]|nr:DUF2624 family protein [Bacilli bacterium]
MNNIISNYVERLTKEDIIKFANMNNLSVSDSEIDFVYTFIKRNYKNVLNNPNSFNLSLYREKFSEDNYLFLENLIKKYKNFIK